jgi:hypothetical protein
MLRNGTIVSIALGVAGVVWLALLATAGFTRSAHDLGGSTAIGGHALLDPDLSDRHPISLPYDTMLAGIDAELLDPITTPSDLPEGLNIDDDMPFGTGNDQLECASCHDVDDGGPLVMALPLLPKSTMSDELCFHCHAE